MHFSTKSLARTLEMRSNVPSTVNEKYMNTASYYILLSLMTGLYTLIVAYHKRMLCLTIGAHNPSIVRITAVGAVSARTFKNTLLLTTTIKMAEPI